MDEHVHHDAHAKGYEDTDIHVRPFAWFFVVFAIVTAIAFVLVSWSYKALVRFENARQAEVLTRVAAPKSEIPKELDLRAGGPEVATLPQNAPMLQADPVKDMDAMFAEQEGKLNSYGWLDREKGVVHVPIEKAMAFALERSMVKAQAAEQVAPAAAAAVAAPASPMPAPAR
ncbi:MAG: hypothetical protein ACSLFQ_08830 [Thermoanaerobaculia bacterium]